MSSRAEHYAAAEVWIEVARLELQPTGTTPATQEERERAAVFATIGQIHATLATADDHVALAAATIRKGAVE